ncbi:MAG: hypothetical protein AB7I19_13575 [Planctomycetota bacterium]
MIPFQTTPVEHPEPVRKLEEFLRNDVKSGRYHSGPDESGTTIDYVPAAYVMAYFTGKGSRVSPQIVPDLVTTLLREERAEFRFVPGSVEAGLPRWIGAIVLDRSWRDRVHMMRIIGGRAADRAIENAEAWLSKRLKLGSLVLDAASQEAHSLITSWSSLECAIARAVAGGHAELSNVSLGLERFPWWRSLDLVRAWDPREGGFDEER